MTSAILIQMLPTNRTAQTKPKMMVLVCVYDGKDRWALEFDSSGYGKAVATLIAELQSSPCFAVFLSKRQRIRRQAGIQECMFQGLSSWDCPRSHR